MSKIIISTLFLLSMTFLAKSININCRYYDNTSDFYALKYVYTCQIMDISAHENPNALITGSHFSGKSNNDVIGIYDSNGRLKTFPRQLGKVFPNLVAFYITGGYIKEIHQEDLKPYPNLIALIFDGSKIEVIEQGLFDFNPYLQAVSIDSKMIRHVSPNVFDNILNLKYLLLSGCASVRIMNDRVGVLNEIERIKSVCQEYVEDPSGQFYTG